MLNIKYENKFKELQPHVEISFLIFCFLFLAQLNSHANDVNASNPKINDSKNTEIINPFHKAKKFDELRQAPNQRTNEQEKRLNLIRNPFASVQANSENGNLMLSRNIIFRGIAKVGNSNVVFADTDKGLSFLKVGSDLGNGFSIKGINLEESLINISNGILTYKVDFKKR